MKTADDCHKCGSSNLRFYVTDDGTQWAVTCLHCSTGGACATSPSKAIELWNTIQRYGKRNLEAALRARGIQNDAGQL